MGVSGDNASHNRWSALVSGKVNGLTDSSSVLVAEAAVPVVTVRNELRFERLFVWLGTKR